MPPLIPGSRGFVYVATGAQYLREAAEATITLRATNPGARVCLVADRVEGPVFWDDLVIIEKPAFGFADKICMGLCPYERFVYLDTDTHILGDLSEMFQLLDRFDFAGHQLFEGHDYQPKGVPDIFPDFNGGVMAFRRSPLVDQFFVRWTELYRTLYALNRDGYYHYANVSDQQSLRIAIYESSLRIAVLGPEYDFVPYHVNFACAAVRILHGRGKRQLEMLGRRINQQYGNRVYVPVLDTIVSTDTLPRELGHLWWMTTLQIIRRLGRQLTPLGLRNRLRRSAVVRSLFLRDTFSRVDTGRSAKWREPPPS